MPDLPPFSTGLSLPPRVAEPHVPRVLVVEDVDTTRRRICSALRAGGYQVEEAIDGLGAWRQLSTGHFDAILLDLVLPHLDGWQLRQMQLNKPELARIPTLIVTARELGQADRYALHARGVIQKPFEDGDLVATVADACRAAQAAPAPGPSSRRRAAGRRAGAVEELFWSRRGEVACGAHAPAPASERWAAERWAAIPAGAGRDRVLYQCQHCSGTPIGHRTARQSSAGHGGDLDTAADAPNPLCPRCQHPMVATERPPKHPDTLAMAGVEDPETGRQTVPIWHCAGCGIDRARFD